MFIVDDDKLSPASIVERMNVITERLERLADVMEALTVAVSSANEIQKQSLTCPTCLGSGKGYSGHRCVPCGGTGWRVRRD